MYGQAQGQSQVDSLLSLSRTLEQSAPDTVLVRVLNQLAYRYDGIKTDSALILAKRAFSIAEQIGDKRGLARACINIGNINETKGQYKTAQESHLQGIAIAESIGDSSIMARGLNGLGIVYWDKGEYQSALQSYLRSLTVYEALRDTTNTARAVNNIAILHQQMNHFKEAMRYYQLSYAIAQKADDKKSILVAQGNIGQLHYLEKRMDSAFVYLQASYTIAKEIDDKHSIAARLNDIGELLQAQGKYDAALKALFESLRIKEAIGESTYIVNSLQSIALAFAASGRGAEALPYAQRAVDSAQAMGAKAYLRDALGILVTVYDSLGQHKRALQTYRMMAELRDSLMSEESQKKSLQLQAEYESVKKDQQIILLTKERELQESTRRMLLVLGVVLCAGLAALYSRYRLKASSEKVLQEHNTEILRQQELLELQAADIETANTALQEKNLVLEHQQNILEEQAREIEIANSALQEKNLTLEQLNAEKNEFLGIAAHDLKNPLTHIIMASGTIERYYERMTDADILDQIRSLNKVAARMTEIISNLLDVNAIEQGGMRFTETSFDVIPKVRATTEMYAAPAKEKNIALHLEAPSSLTILADEQATVQVLDNIISNAVKYSPQGKNVFIRVKASGDAVRVEVQDEGAGISPEDMKKLFGKFARLSTRPTGGEHSTGLGLSIVKKMVEAMNGRVWCESRTGNEHPTGATFIVELPQSI